MTLNELKNKLLSERHILGALQVVCGEKSRASNVLGIYEENGVWYLYDTDDRGGIVVFDKGDENYITEELYQWVLKEEKRELKKQEWKKQKEKSTLKKKE